MSENRDPDSPQTPSQQGSDPLAETPERIGPYKILQTLGEGGMGLIYEAEQTEPVHRRVALKIIKLGMDTRQVVARFEAERQALAVMDHPNIAQVYDAGATATGRPYFAMELVKGTPITDYCDTHKLGTEERLRLFIQVCRAVQHAHQKGVIHRDLKPSNVLVVVRDDQPVPKVIDFGIAKAMGQSLTEKTLVTQLGQMVGTPEYMSPEQAERTGLDIDTRTDIYSLGVMLYELLVGALPFDLGSVAGPAVPSALREKEAPTPSARLTTLPGDTQETVARYRHTDPTSLKRELKGDLDWVVMKCLEKDRTRRYETANGLAMEIERFLAYEPVLARPPSASYRVQKFVRRNRAGVAAAAVALLAITAGGVAATVGMVRAQRAERVAAQEAETAREVSDFLVGLFEVSDPSEARGNQITAREILDRGSRDIETQLADQPLVQARLLATMGTVYRQLGLYGGAEPLLRRSLANRESVLPAGHLDIATSMLELGHLYWQQGRFEEAEPLLQRALEMREAALGPDELEVARAAGSLGGMYLEQGRYEQAGPLLQRALEISETHPDCDDAELAQRVSDVGALYWLQQKFDEAEPYLRRALEIRERVLGGDHPDLAQGLNNLGVLYWMQGEYEQAGRHYERARVIWEKALGPDHETTAKVYNNLGETYWVLGRYDEAEQLLRQSLTVKERTLEPDHPSLATTLGALANVYRDAGRQGEAEPLYRRALSIREAAMGARDPWLAGMLEDYARLLRSTDRTAEAERLEQRARAIRGGDADAG